jgi:hypothetical protein
MKGKTGSSKLTKYQMKGEVKPTPNKINRFTPDQIGKMKEEAQGKKRGFEKGTYTPPKYKNKIDSIIETNKGLFGDGKDPKIEYLGNKKIGGSVGKSKKK